MTEKELDEMLWKLVLFKGEKASEQCEKNMKIREIYWEIMRIKDD